MAQTLLPSLPSELSGSLAPLLDRQDLRGLLPIVKTTPNSVWRDAATFAAWYQLQGLFKKVPWTASETGLDPETEALRTFLATETKCDRNNRRFRNRHWWRDYDLAKYVTEARRIIAEILAKVSIDDVENSCRWSGGATTSVRGESTHLAAKWDGVWGCTPDAYHTVTRWLGRVPDFQLALSRNGDYGCFDERQAVTAVRSLVTMEQCCEVMFVTKTAWTHRTVTLPILLCNYMQNGIGDVFRTALLREGIDLRDQGLNQKLAREGAITGKRATIDLSTASELICYELVKLLFPPEWFDLMCEARERLIRLPDGSTMVLQKMCGMGNGYCFPMQTLIFYALSRAAGATQVRVYGDDIIVNSDAAASVMYVLQRCGLRVNRDKSYWTGPFRESCGSNWYRDQEVTPVYVRNRVLTPRECFTIHNQFIRKGVPYDSKMLSMLRKYVRSSDRYVAYIDDVTDGGFLSPLDVIMASEHAKWDRDRWSWNCKALRLSGLPDNREYTPLAVYWMFLQGGLPSRRFRTRTNSSWHLCSLRNKKRAKVREDLNSTPAAMAGGSV